MFSTTSMALPQHVLDRLPPALLRGGMLSSAGAPATGLALGLGELDALLPDGGLLRGGVTELSVAGAAAGATRLSLLACRAVQAEGRARGGGAPWCAFVDASSTLYGPGVAEAGVQLDRLLVVRPPREALARVSARLVESRAFALVIIDTVGVPGCPLDVSLGTWPRVVRRLAMAVEGTDASVLLVTAAKASRPLPLPVAQRIELVRSSEQTLDVRIAKDRQGRLSSQRRIAWERPGPKKCVAEASTPSAAGAR
jgi:hypothetical protein